MQAVIYGRVSTEEQYRSGFSLAEQLKACRELARSLTIGPDGALPIVEFTDSVSGELLERPGLQAALDLVRSRQVRAFICLDPDRLARRLMHQLLVTDEIERNGCRLEFVQHDYQESPEGRLFYQLRGAIAEFEKAKIIERTSRGQRGKVAAGGLPHAVRMYGYRFIKGAGKQAPARAVLLPDPGEVRWVSQIFRWCAEEGIGPLSIARRLNQLGVPTKTGKGLWQHTQIRRILTHATYATGLLALGKRDHRGIAVARRLTAGQRQAKGITLTARPKPRSQWQCVSVEPLIPEDLWQTAQEVLRRLRCTKAKPDGQEHPRLLSGLGRCGLCGGPLYYLNGNKIVCATRYAHHWHNRAPTDAPADCRLPAKPRAAVESAVWEAVKSWLLEPDRVNEALQRLLAETRPQPAEQAGAAEVETLSRELEQRESELERLGLLFARGLWPEEKAIPVMEAVRRHITALEARQNALQAQPEGATNAQPGVLLGSLTEQERLTAVAQTLQMLPDEKKARLIRLALERFELLPTGRGAAPAVGVWPASQPPAAGESR